MSSLTSHPVLTSLQGSECFISFILELLNLGSLGVNALIARSDFLYVISNLVRVHREALETGDVVDGTLLGSRTIIEIIEFLPCIVIIALEDGIVTSHSSVVAVVTSLPLLLNSSELVTIAGN